MALIEDLMLSQEQYFTHKFHFDTGVDPTSCVMAVSEFKKKEGSQGRK